MKSSEQPGFANNDSTFEELIEALMAESGPIEPAAGAEQLNLFDLVEQKKGRNVIECDTE
jgi:hypothetical protein